MRDYLLGGLVGGFSVVAQVGFAETAVAPSFSCDKAESDAEMAVCSDDQLATLDLELARLYGLAVAGPNMNSGRLANLKATQRGWIKGRDECWKEPDNIPGCVAANYTMRIDEVRTGYGDARTQDDAGISIGPLAYRCVGLDALVSVVLVQSDPQMVSLRWRENWIVGTQTPTASGAKFTAETYDGAAEFWMKGDQAMLTPPGQSELTCVQEETG